MVKSAGRGWRILPTAVVIEVCKSIGCAEPDNHCCLSCGVSVGQIWWVHVRRGQLVQGRNS